MKELKKIFEVIKLSKFIENFTDIGVNSGIRHRFSGIATNSSDKQKGLTEADKKAIKEGLLKLASDIKKQADKI